MKSHDFAGFFAALNHQEPFPWQVRLADALCDRKWPEAVHVPTACGKTSVLDAFIFALAFTEGRGFPRRLFYAIDRRLVVDDILGHAKQIECAVKQALTEPQIAEKDLLAVAQKLAALSTDGEPLVACGMRGGGRLELDWAYAPDVPALAVSTVDQVGSRLLFQGYGVSEYARPVHAGLTGCDSAFILDEAHLSRPFAQTLKRAARWSALAERPVARPPIAVEVTATPNAQKKNAIGLGEGDWANAEIHKRTCRPKLVELREAKEARFAAEAAASGRDFLNEPGIQVVGIIVNRVQTAREIFNYLREDGQLDVFLLTGRIRPVDRDRLLDQLLARCHATRKRDVQRQSVIVATQTIEVGANLDFDALVTECAPLSALKQRFGRLNRLGLRESAEAIILHRVPEKSERTDPVYGDVLNEHWKWLRSLEKALPKPKQKRDKSSIPPPRIDFATHKFGALAKLVDGEPVEPKQEAPPPA